jgi:hypothetical protein
MQHVAEKQREGAERIEAVDAFGSGHRRVLHARCAASPSGTTTLRTISQMATPPKKNPTAGVNHCARNQSAASPAQGAPRAVDF